jgi:hypothetical protein
VWSLNFNEDLYAYEHEEEGRVSVSFDSIHWMMSLISFIV